MKRITVLAFSVLLVVGCSPAKNLYKSAEQTKDNTEQQLASKNEVVIDSTAETSVRDVTATNANTASVAECETDEEVTTTVKEYDTDKPTDAATGTPPLKKETMQSRRKVSAEKQQKQTGQTTERTSVLSGTAHKQQTDNTDLHTTIQTRSDTVKQVESEQKRGLNAFQRLLCYLGVIAVLGVAAWLCCKLLKRHL